MLVVLVESSEGFGAGRIYFDRSSIYLREGLYLYIISPHSILRLSINIFIKFFSHIVLEEDFFVFNVLETKLSDLFVVLLGSCIRKDGTI